MHAVQGTLVRRKFGVVEVQRIVADHGVEVISFKGDIHFALAVGIVDERTFVAVNRVDSVWINVRNEPFILEFTEVAEHLTNLVGAGVVRGGDEVFTPNRTLQVKRDAAFRLDFVEVFSARGLKIALARNLADLGVGQCHDEQ